MGKLREVFEATSGAAARLQPAAAAKDASVPQPAEAFTAAAANGPQPVATASASAAEDKVGTSLLCCQLRSLPVHHQSYKKISYTALSVLAPKSSTCPWSDMCCYEPGNGAYMGVMLPCPRDQAMASGVRNPKRCIIDVGPGGRP